MASWSPRVAKSTRITTISASCQNLCWSSVSFRSGIHGESIYREKTYVCDYPSQSPREVVARTVANRRFVCPGYFWGFGRSDQAEADPGPLQPVVCGLHEP